MQAEYVYNALGQQVVRRLVQEGRTVHAVHDVDGHRIAEYEWDEVAQTSTLLREYVWMEGMAVAVVEGGTVYFVRTDHIGRPVFATDATGAKVWEVEYLPFGGVHTSSGDTIALRFPGQWYQSESGLHQNWMRDYDPTTGRYIQADPLGLVAGVSLYGYALQNPYRYIDPNGEHPVLAAMALGAAAALLLDFSLDMLFGDGCYTLKEAAVAAGLGAIFAGVGFWASGVRRAGTEFSHAIPTRALNQSRFGRWLNGRGNRYRSLNGNYVSPYFHARTDPFRHLRGGTPTLPLPIRLPLRTPAWLYGAPAAAAISSDDIETCGCSGFQGSIAQWR